MKQGIIRCRNSAAKIDLLGATGIECRQSPRLLEEIAV